MGKSAEIIELTQSGECDGMGLSPERIREALNRVVQSKTFQRARRLKTLLKYVVTAAIKGESSGQSRTARELFGKSADFDPSIDPVIRVQFGRLRRALASYYEREGRTDRVVIDIPSRRYDAIFHDGAGAIEPPNGNRVDQSAAGNGFQSLARTAATSGGDSGSLDGGRPIIAVLPFENLTDDPAQDSFCYGLTEEITNGLAALESIDVVASSSTYQFKHEHFDVREVGRELGVPLVLEGSVRMEEGHTRVIAQLARSNDGVAVWSDSFDDQMNGSLNTQKSIARKVMDTLPLSSYEA